METCSPSAISRQRRPDVTDTGDPAIRRRRPELLCQRRGHGLLASQVLDRRAFGLGRHGADLVAVGLIIDASCAVGHVGIAAYVSQISYPVLVHPYPETLLRSHFSWIFVLA